MKTERGKLGVERHKELWQDTGEEDSARNKDA